MSSSPTASSRFGAHVVPARHLGILPIEGDELPGRGLSPLDEAIGAETRARYEAALGRLRPEDRELIIARIEMGLPYKEMVEMFHKPSVSAVTMAVSRAVVRLAQENAHA